jgi:hypothetical protein
MIERDGSEKVCPLPTNSSSARRLSRQEIDALRQDMKESSVLAREELKRRKLESHDNCSTDGISSGANCKPEYSRRV